MNDTETRSVEHIFRWDLDKTYLQTEFSTVGDLVHTALQTPEEKQNVPGSVELLRELKRSFGDRCLVTFVSGSPSQMRDKIERKFELDGIRPDLFVLKPTLRYILTGQFSAIRSQVGYKLDALLKLRTRSSIAPETMFGDDAEQDAFIYSLYADLVAGRIEADELVDILREAGTIYESADSIAEHLADTHLEETVRRIFIYLEGGTPPGRFRVFGPRLVPISNYFQAAVMLFADGVLPVSATMRVAASLIEHHDYTMLSLARSAESLMRRRHLSPSALDTLAEAADDSEVHSDLPEDFLPRFVSHARSLAPRPRTEPLDHVQRPNYLEILRSDRALRESVDESPGWFQRVFGRR